MEISRILISIVLFIMLFSGISYFINSMYANYGIQIQNPHLEKIMQDIKRNEEETKQRLERIQSPNIIDKILGAFDLLIGGIWNAFIGTFATFPIIISNFFYALPISLPDWFISGILVIIVITLVSAAIYLIMKVKV